MKKVFKGKVYDTETATSVGILKSNMKSYLWTIETLYRKKTGEFFLHGKGSVLSQYSQNIGNNEWTDGEEIIPMSFEAAEKWTKENLDEETYRKFFGPISEDDEKKTVSISIMKSTHEIVKRIASQRDVSVSEYIENLILKEENEHNK